MKSLYVLVPLLALLIAALCFDVVTWTSLVDTVPLYGWFAIGGGVLFSLLIGGGLMVDVLQRPPRLRRYRRRPLGISAGVGIAVHNVLVIRAGINWRF
jgi:uncharacterized membrane protein